MGQTQGKGMKCDPLNSGEGGSAVEDVTCNGEADGGEVSVDLVGTTGARHCLDKGVAVEPVQDEKLGEGLLAAAVIDHGAVTAVAIWSERLADNFLVPFRNPAHNRMIDLYG